MTLLAQNLKIIRKNQPHANSSRQIDVGFRTYVRNEVGERDAPVNVLIKMARLGNISLDQLLTTALTVDKLEIPSSLPILIILLL